jgi:hypothetical protein
MLAALERHSTNTEQNLKNSGEIGNSLEFWGL